MSLWLYQAQERVRAHHRNQFGLQPLPVRALKLCEEAGEVAGAVMRHVTERDGKDWRAEIESEIQDVLVTLMTLSGDPELMFDFGDLIEEAVNKFAKREWKVSKW